MSRINSIQQTILELSPGKFQKLGDAYFHNIGYKNLVSTGSVEGSDKTRSGTPDSLFLLDNGKYAFVEYTTKEEDVFGKFKGDLKSCFNESITGIPVEKIDEIIFCYSSELKGEQIEFFRKQCQNKGIKFSNVGMGRLSYDLFEKHHLIVKDILEIEIDTGQILTIREFVQLYQSNRFSTPLDTRFYFRQSELSDSLSKIDKEKVVFIEGKPGVGKSRLAIECCKKYLETHSEYVCKCIYNKGQDIFEDLKIHFSQSGKYLIFVDDANRVSGFNYVLSLLNQTSSDIEIKIIATVRDYAINRLIEKTEPFATCARVNVNLFERKELETLIGDEFNIKNGLYLERIWNISKGNARLAVMAAKTAKNQPLQSINDASKLYDLYFSSVKEDIESITDKNTLMVAGILAFYRKVDRTNSEQMNSVHKVFGIAPHLFWQGITKLHDLEILDLYEDEIAKFSDQILSTYIFYLVFFKNQNIKYSTLLKSCFPQYKEKLLDALNPVLNTFYTTELVELVKKETKLLYDEYVEKSDSSSQLLLLDDFSYFLQTETLLYLKSEIDREKEEIDYAWQNEKEINTFTPRPSILSLLEKFYHTDEATLLIVFDLLMKYVNKKPSVLPNIIHILTNVYSFTHRSAYYGCYLQKLLIQKVIEIQKSIPSDLNTYILLKLLEHYLKIEYNHQENDGNRTMNLYTLSLSPEQDTFDFRIMLWNALFDVYKSRKTQDSVLKIMQKYMSNYMYAADEGSLIIERDITSLLPFIHNRLKKVSYLHCVIVQSLCDQFDRLKIKYDDKLRSKYSNKAYQLTDLLFVDIYEMKNENLKWEEYQQLRRQRIKEYCKNYSLNNYKILIKDCFEIYSHPVRDRDQYQISEGLIELFYVLSEIKPKIFVQVAQYYISINNPLDIPPALIITCLLKSTTKDEACRVIIKSTLKNKKTRRKMLFAYYECLANNQMKQSDVKKILSLYKKADPDDPPSHTDYLLKYQEFDDTLIPQVGKLMLEKIKEDKNYTRTISMLFNPFSEAGKSLSKIFINNKALLKNLYYALEDSKQTSDINDKIIKHIYDLDSNFLFEYYDRLYAQNEYITSYQDNIEYAFLWLYDDYQKRIGGILRYLKKLEIKGFYSSLYAGRIFIVTKGSKNLVTVIERQNQYLENEIIKHHSSFQWMMFLFATISSIDDERRKQLLLCFIKYNKRIEHFKKLQIEPNGWTFNGSRAPVVQTRIVYFQSLLPHMNTIDLLAHKQYIENRISELRTELEFWKKKDFLGE